MSDWTVYCALGISALVAFGTLVKDLLGGSSKLSDKFNSLDKRISKDVADLRTEFHLRVDEHSDHSRVGLDAISANIHRMELGLLEFRVKMAEEYMRRDTYDELKREIKGDMKEGFDRVEKTLDEMSRAIEAGRKANNGKSNT